ncbi:unnamed protein product [Rhizophagus irregularis]|uniref:Uncharacterized protein n=1 Tax=Rhizophagus irregularis TaxID=588596 RepID=A0A915Z473_9GLOM|nr:unnamed protein product [Rhizophagus irregularis]CAB5211377.1 unnamed protein product [Rhizophagus irregularis]CAB5361196.1 unnamed protein product [Rhizophagus irregularis]
MSFFKILSIAIPAHDFILFGSFYKQFLYQRISGAFILAFCSDKTGLLGIGCELVDDSDEGISEVPESILDTITSVNSSGIGSSGVL